MVSWPTIRSSSWRRCPWFWPTRGVQKLIWHPGCPGGLSRGTRSPARYPSKVRMLAVDAEIRQWSRRRALEFAVVAQRWLAADTRR